MYVISECTSQNPFRGAGWPGVYAGRADHCSYARQNKGKTNRRDN